MSNLHTPFASTAKQRERHYSSLLNVVQEHILRFQFDAMASEWKSQTAHFSSGRRKVRHPAYRSIVGLGPPVVPLILDDLFATGGHWFPALREITGVNPASAVPSGNINKVKEAWFRWGMEQARWVPPGRTFWSDYSRDLGHGVLQVQKMIPTTASLMLPAILRTGGNPTARTATGLKQQHPVTTYLISGAALQSSDSRSAKAGRSKQAIRKSLSTKTRTASGRMLLVKHQRASGRVS